MAAPFVPETYSIPADAYITGEVLLEHIGAFVNSLPENNTYDPALLGGVTSWIRGQPAGMTYQPAMVEEVVNFVLQHGQEMSAP